MPNPIGKTGTHNRKATYANQVLAMARTETNIYDDFSTDYEKDEVTGKIMVPTRNGDVKVSDYDVLNGIELTQSKTDYIELPVDQDYGVNELIDGYEAEAVPDNIKAQRIESAGFSIGTKKENLAIAALMKGTISPDKEAVTESNVYKKIAAEIANMKKRGMKVKNMRVAISSDTELALLTDEKFSNTASTIGAELVREGVIGKIAGVATKPNYLMPANVEFIIYDKRFCQKYEVWKKEPAINSLADGKHIGASALQGRQVGGVMVTNPLGVQIKTNGDATEIDSTGDEKKLTIDGPDELTQSSGQSLKSLIEANYTAKDDSVEVDGTFDFEDAGATSDGDDLIKIIFTPDSEEYDVADKTITLKFEFSQENIPGTGVPTSKPTTDNVDNEDEEFEAEM